MSQAPVVTPEALQRGELSVLGRIRPASNHTYLAELAPGGDRVVYKPRAGERPLWDFPHGTLADREYAAWLVSNSLGWDVVPPTVLRDGPLGPGMVQAWCEPDPVQRPVDVVLAGHVPEGHVSVLLAEDGEGRDVELTHEDTPELLRMAVFDVLTNNTDRKGGHVLPMPGGHRYGVDHGICFHEDDKLRTVLWGFAGRPLGALSSAVPSVLGADVLASVEEHLAGPEVDAFVRRCERLLAEGVLPEMGPGWPSIPWPPF